MQKATFRDNKLWPMPEVQEPETNDYSSEKNGVITLRRVDYEVAMRAHTAYLSTLLPVPTDLRHHFKEGEVYEEGRDYEVRCKVKNGNALLAMKTEDVEYEKAAIPIETKERVEESVDQKISRLLELTDEFVFPAFYSHTGKKMWKISNVYTKYKDETLVLCGVDEGIERAIDLAITEISKKREEYYAAPPVNTHI